jgi:hypothetical protein
MSDNELTISDYYEEYPIMRYILPGLVYNNGAVPQTNISNNAFILRQGAWILSKILDDEHTEYGYETFHPAQKYVIGDINNTVSIDRNKQSNITVNIQLCVNNIIYFTRKNPVRGTNRAGVAAFYVAGPPIAFAAGPNAIQDYLNDCMMTVNNMFDINPYLQGMCMTEITAIMNLPAIIGLFPNPAGAGGAANNRDYTPAQIDTIINALTGLGGPINASFANFYNLIKTVCPNPYDIPYYIILSLIYGIIQILASLVSIVAQPDSGGISIIQIIEEAILSPLTMRYIISLSMNGIDGNRNHRKNIFFNRLTAPVPDLNKAIGLYVSHGLNGSFIVPYTDHEERSESTGGDTIDNRDLLNGVPAGAEPKLNQFGDRIRNGRKGDHIATVLTPDDIRLLAIFLQLAAEHFNANSAIILYNSRNDVNYRDNKRGIRVQGTIASYFDHLIALRETDHTVRRSSGLNQGKVEALSVLAGLRYAIQGPIFPVLSQTVFHLVAHYFVRLVLHDSRAAAGAPADMNFHNEDIYDVIGNQFMRFIGGNGKELQLLSELSDQVSLTITPPAGTVFGCPGVFANRINPNDKPVMPPVMNVNYDHDTQVINFIQLIQSFIGPGNVDAVNPASTTFNRIGNPGELNAAAVGQPDNMIGTYEIIRKAHDDIKTFVTGMPFNYTFLENNNAGGALEPVFNAFAGSLAFNGHQELSNINISNIEPTLFDADIRHLLQFNVTDKAIRVFGNEVHIIGTSTQNSFTGALIGPKENIGNGSQFIINNYGFLEYQEIINGQVVQTDNSQLYNKMIGNNDYCKVFGSARLDDPVRNKVNVCNTMISACSIIGNYGDPKKCAAVFREIDDNHVSKNLRGWNTLNKNLTQLNAYKILTGMGFDPVINKNGDITFKDENNNNNYIFNDQKIFEQLELSKGVGIPAPGAGPNVPNLNTSNHVKYVKNLMKTVGTIKITKNPQDKNNNKNNIPTLQLSIFPQHQIRRAETIQLGFNSFSQRGGENQERQINIMYGGNNCDLQRVRRDIDKLLQNATEKGVILKKTDKKKLDKMLNDLEIYHKELTEIEIYYKASEAFKNQNRRNPLQFELKNKMIELKNKRDIGFTKIEKVKQAITKAYLVMS